MPEHVRGFLVDPTRRASAPESSRREPSLVASLAVDLLVVAVVDRVKVELLGTGQARGALLVVALAAGVDLLRFEDLAAAPTRDRYTYPLALFV